PMEVNLPALVVDLFLIHHPSAIFVDLDHAVPKRVPDVLRGGRHTQRDLDRALVPPCVRHVAELGANLGGDANKVARVGVCSNAAEDGPSKELASEILVVEKTTGTKHDAPPGTNQDSTPAGLRLHA